VNWPLLLAAFDNQPVLPAVDAVLNALAACLLITGYAQIKRGRERAHQWTMLAAFAVSVVFLACYVTYHFVLKHEETRFAGPASIRYLYFAVLISHVLLAFAVPFLATATIWLGLTDRRPRHRRLARWTLPIWLYVSVTGVIIYVVLYHLYPAAATSRIMP
jgi:putative membrane protein